MEKNEANNTGKYVEVTIDSHVEPHVEPYFETYGEPFVTRKNKTPKWKSVTKKTSPYRESMYNQVILTQMLM